MDVGVAMFWGIIIGFGLGTIIMRNIKCKEEEKPRPTLPDKIPDPSIWGKYEGFLEPRGLHETNPFKDN